MRIIFDNNPPDLIISIFQLSLNYINPKVSFMKIGGTQLTPLLFAFFTNSFIYSAYGQNYSFKNFLEDSKLREKIENYSSYFEKDSLFIHLKEYKDKLRYQGYLYQSILLNRRSDTSWKNKLDTSFALGLSYPCIRQGMFKENDSSYIQRSYKNNYLNAFDKSYLTVIDSLQVEDQRYRGSIVQGMEKHLKDSLLFLQASIDKSNFNFYKKLIESKGWPSFKKVGGQSCSFKSANPNMVIVHLGVKEREFQISLIQKLVELCEKQEEDWGNIIWLLSNLYYRPQDYSEYSLLKFKNTKLEKEASQFAFYCMTELLVKMPSKRLVLKCQNKELFEDIKKHMLEMNSWVIIPYVDEEMAKELHIAVPKKLDTDYFIFEENKSLSYDQVFFKIVSR